MNDQEKRFIIKYFVLPIFIIESVFVVLMNCIMTDYEYSIITAIEYSVSYLMLEFALPIPDYSVTLPITYHQVLLEHHLPTEVSLIDFKIFLDVIHGGTCWRYLGIIPVSIIALATGIILCIKAPAVTPEMKYKQDKYIRGIRKVSAEILCRKSQQSNDPGMVLHTHTGKLVLNRQREKEHFLILGSTGTGKSTLLMMIVQYFKTLGKRIIILDRKGEFYGHFGTGEDIIFNPFDQRTAAWSIFNEIRFEMDSAGKISDVPPDLRVVADILFGVSDTKDNDKNNDQYWYKAAAGVFCSAVCWCVLHNKTTMEDLVICINQPAEELIRRFKRLPVGMQTGLQYLGEKAGERANSIVSILASVSRQLECFAGKDGDFSIRQWINEGHGSLFLSTAGRNDTVFTSIIKLFIDLIGREIKEFPDDGGQDTNLVFVIDELGALPALETLSFLLTQARSKGVCCILANQTFEKIKAVYGEHEARNIVACAKTRFLFQMPEPTDAEYLSKVIGNCEVERLALNRSEHYSGVLSMPTGKRSTSYNRSITKDSAFIPAELETLPTGHAVACIPDLFPKVAEVYFKKQDIAAINPEFLPVEVNEVSAKVVSRFIDEGKNETASDEEGNIRTDFDKDEELGMFF